MDGGSDLVLEHADSKKTSTADSLFISKDTLKESKEVLIG